MITSQGKDFSFSSHHSIQDLDNFEVKLLNKSSPPELPLLKLNGSFTAVHCLLAMLPWSLEYSATLTHTIDQLMQRSPQGLLIRNVLACLASLRRLGGGYTYLSRGVGKIGISNSNPLVTVRYGSYSSVLQHRWMILAERSRAGVEAGYGG